MSTSAAPVALEFLRVQNAFEANGKVMNDNTCLEFVPGKQLAKHRLMQDLSRIKPQMMQKVLSSIGSPEDKKANFAHVNRQPEGFDGSSETSSHAEMLKLFPVSTGFGSNPRVTEKNINLPFAIGQADSDSRSVPAKVPEQQSINQLTIFYNGTVNVYDVPADKAEAIMSLAVANSSSNTAISTMTRPKIEQIWKPLPSKPASNAVKENQIQRLPVGLEIVRKLSLQRFLEKRKERINSVAPYTTLKTATLVSKEGKRSDDQIILSLACPSQQY